MAPLTPTDITQGRAAYNKQAVTGKSILFEMNIIFTHPPHPNEK